MKSFTALLLPVIICKIAIAQTDSTTLLKDAEMKLQNRTADASSVLTNKTYASLHPVARFREMIKKHAPTGVLTITTDDEPGKKIKVIATVKNKDGQPVANALVYLYQTDSRGWYAADPRDTGH